MEKKINVLGVEIDNYLTDDSNPFINEYLDNDCMNTISIIQIPTLLRAVDEEEFREYIENMDLTIVGDKAILEAAGLIDERKLKEAEDGEFIVQFFRNVIMRKKTIFILGEKEQDIDKYMKVVTKNHIGLNIAGKYAISGYDQDCDSIVNEINSVAPDVILSILSSPFQEKFVSENKSKISAKVWIGLGDYLQFTDLKPNMNWLSKLIEKKILLSKVKKYENENGE